jgi:hypothetical protein
MNYTTQAYGIDQANEYKQPNDNSQAHNYDYEDDYVPSDDQADSEDQGSDGGAPVGLGLQGSSGAISLLTFVHTAVASLCQIWADIFLITALRGMGTESLLVSNLWDCGKIELALIG